MKCIHNEKHIKTETICQECLKNIDDEVLFPDLNKIDPELRPLLTQLTVQNTDLCACWKSSYTTLTIYGKRLKIENVYYAFFKADVGNFRLKRICGTPACVNPNHLVSRFETPAIKKKVRAGFNRKFKDLGDLTDDQWCRYT